jgi:hypothetical protein
MKEARIMIASDGVVGGIILPLSSKNRVVAILVHLGGHYDNQGKGEKNGNANHD